MRFSGFLISKILEFLGRVFPDFWYPKFWIFKVVFFHIFGIKNWSFWSFSGLCFSGKLGSNGRHGWCVRCVVLFMVLVRCSVPFQCVFNCISTGTMRRPQFNVPRPRQIWGAALPSVKFLENYRQKMGHAFLRPRRARFCCPATNGTPTGLPCCLT